MYSRSTYSCGYNHIVVGPPCAAASDTSCNQASGDDEQGKGHEHDSDDKQTRAFVGRDIVRIGQARRDEVWGIVRELADEADEGVELGEVGADGHGER
jgi:hypothetical protein